MQIVSRVRDSFHVEVPLADLLESPTVADMAVVIAPHPGVPWSEKDIERMSAEVQGRPEDEAQRRLAEERATYH